MAMLVSMLDVGCSKPELSLQRMFNPSFDHRTTNFDPSFVNDNRITLMNKPEKHENPSIEPGVLYVISTPIGNLEDITLRALRVLKEVDVVAAEDTRHTGLLLKHYGIEKRLESYHDFNKEKKAPDLIEELKSGRAVAVTSDAGTPGISDPCYLLVKLEIGRASCRERV